MSAERGPELARFQGRARDRRSVALLRAVTGVLALLGSLAMLIGRLPIPVFLVALLGLAMGLAWLRQARKLWRASKHALQPTLVVHRAGFAVDDTFIAFDQVEAFEVDEEHLDVRVCLTGGDSLRIDPQYQGVDIYTLVRTLQDALGASRRTK